MKLIYILPTLSFGGAELRGIERINALSAFPDITIKLIVLSDKIQLINNVDKKVVVDVLELKNSQVFSKNAFFSSITNSIKLRRSILAFNPDVIVASLPISHHLVRLAMLPSKKKIKIYQYHHATQFIENPIRKLSHRVLHNIAKLLSKKIDYGHIFISEAVKDDISSNMQIKNGHVLYNAIPDKFNDVRNLQSGLNSDNFNIVIPGRLISVKGHISALEVCRTFMVSKPNVKVWIIGEGTERKNIENFINKNKLINSIYLIGELPHTRLLGYLYGSDIVLIPSISEGLGNVAIEALMVGATVVSSSAGGLKEIINNPDIGFLYNIEESEQLLYILENIYDKKVILSKEEIRASYLERFTLEKHVEKLLKIINEK